LVSSTCPNGSFIYQSNCYIFNSTGVGFEEAELTCKEYGGHLASIHDAFTNSALHTASQNYSGTSYWIGARRYPYEAIPWEWTDRTPWDFTDWGPYGYINSPVYDCAHMYVTAGDWDASTKYDTLPFLCKVSATS
uniref:C-type lectin domain-containing protein n=1 Tax=Panagrolaimus sp. ES5 TaxID=591445 RepID=A0AC34F3M0_9BILA